MYSISANGTFSADWAAVTDNATTATNAQIGEWMINKGGGKWDHVPLSSNGITESDADLRYLRVLMLQQAIKPA